MRPGARATILLVLFIVMPGCGGGMPLIPPWKAPEPTAVIEACDQPVVSYRVSGGLTGRTRQWTIWGDGTVKDVGGREGQAPKPEVDHLFRRLETAGFLKWRDTYYDPTAVCNDCFTYVLTACVSGKKKSTSTRSDGKDVPESMGPIIADIEHIAAKALP